MSSFGPTRRAGSVLFLRAGALGLATIGLATIGFAALGLAALGLAALGLATLGLATLGLAALGLATLGFAASPGLSSDNSIFPSAPLTVVDKVGAALGLAPL